ncbi:hypothetical protein, partial [Sphingobium sp. TCM1]|uniref:hypothetical protein n=1 Tax=Sphingobium sp. TCM1 TaxID=453246 RepID=UPI001E5642E5
FSPDPQTNPTPAYPRGEITPARKADDFPKPEWADPQVWADFMLNRKRKRMTNSATAYRGFLRDIEKHTDADWPPGRLLEHAAAKGWASINAPENQDIRHAAHAQSYVRQGVGNLRGPRPEPAIDMLRQAQADLANDSGEGEGFDRETWPSLPSYLTERS